MTWREDSRPEDHAIDFSKEIIFSNFGGDPLGGDGSYTQFTDEMIDGREYTLDLSIQLDRDLSVWEDSSNKYEVTGQRVIVEIQTISESLFKYLRSVEMIGGEHNFSEPVRLFTNVQGGYGIFGLYNTASKTLELPLLDK